MNPKGKLYKLLNTLPQTGKVSWIGIRPARNIEMTALTSVDIEVGKGLVGDRYAGIHESTRQVTLIQQEHLDVIGACLAEDSIIPERLRRNIVVCGINLLALKDKQFRVGGCELEMTGLCHPCSKMETELGAGGYNAMRGHGGITARVLQGATILIGDPVCFLSPDR